MTSKVTTLTSTSEETEIVSYTYNLQNRMSRVVTDSDPAVSDNAVDITEYTYNPNGIRTDKHTWTETSGASNNDDVYTDYLIDPANHTGYAQVLEETTGSSTITYTIGDDVIAQHNATDGTEYMLYDGHGSTRQLAKQDKSIIDSYSYDGYGVMLSDSTTSGAGAAANADTTMLYAGEQYDSSASMYYNRARYYNPSNGLFNRVDPYSGNRYDPQSLHKYAYCHNNPINAIDPSGLMEFSIGSVNVIISISGLIQAAIFVAVVYLAWRYVVKPVFGFFYLMHALMTAPPLPEGSRNTIINQIDVYWKSNSSNKKMQKLKNWLEDDMIDIRVIPENKWAEGMYFGKIIGLPQSAIDEGDDLGLTLVMFGEWQHHPGGGGLPDTQATQDEFNLVRRKIPNHLRTSYVNRIHHGGTTNSY